MNDAQLFFCLCQVATGAYSIQNGVPLWAVLGAAAIAWAYVVLSTPLRVWLKEVASEQSYTNTPDPAVLVARIILRVNGLFSLWLLAFAPVYVARLLVQWVG